MAGKAAVVTTTEKLTRTKVRREPEKKRREIHIFKHYRASTNTIALLEPREALDAATLAELDCLPKQRTKIPWDNHDIATAAQICERHGWRLDDVWRDERGELHVRMSKEDA